MLHVWAGSATIRTPRRASAPQVPTPRRGTPVRHLFVRVDVDPAAAKAWAAMRAAFGAQAGGFKLPR